MELIVFAVFAVVFAMGHNYFMPGFAAKVATYPRTSSVSGRVCGTDGCYGCTCVWFADRTRLRAFDVRAEGFSRSRRNLLGFLGVNP